MVFYYILMIDWFPSIRASSSELNCTVQVGDWGRNGLYNQSEVAKAMGRVRHNLDFVISVGDNFYESGLTSVEDTQFDTSFTAVYTAESLQVR